MNFLPAGLRPQLGGVSLTKLAKRLLKPLVLWALEKVKDDVEENWQQGSGPGEL